MDVCGADFISAIIYAEKFIMFRGSSFHTIDPKGRVIVPARFRDVIRAEGQRSVMVSRMDSSLFAYTQDEWNNIEKRILSLAQKSESMRRFRRVFIGGAAACSLDRQHRILIPPALRHYAELEKEIVLVGVLDHFEIWSRENWDAENAQLEEDMKSGEIRDEIAGLGL
ncbi:division/cell wall cluster transcriptional repressor MraZ [Desulfobacterales bacterium HSG16]|nr:division/cell wall cluster transcriptional repressor MraZ [Desulfobacterales bacterium HSG16]